MIKIYKIEFADGCSYVGQTRQAIAQRLLQHKRNPCNTELTVRLKDRVGYEVSVLSQHRSQARADRAEVAAIAGQERGLNITKHLGMVKPKGVGLRTKHPPFHYRKGGKRRVRDYDRDESRIQICRHCKRRLTAKQYWSDRSRSSGLQSACKSCHNRIAEELKQAKLTNSLASQAYVLSLIHI